MNTKEKHRIGLSYLEDGEHPDGDLTYFVSPYGRAGKNDGVGLWLTIHRDVQHGVNDKNELSINIVRAIQDCLYEQINQFELGDANGATRINAAILQLEAVVRRTKKVLSQAELGSARRP